MNYIKKNLKSALMVVIAVGILGFAAVSQADEAKLLNLNSKLEDMSDQTLDLNKQINLLEIEKCSTTQDIAKLKLSLLFSGDRELQGDENEQELLDKKNADCGKVKNGSSIGPVVPVAPIDLTDVKPKDLFYTFLVTDGAAVSQSAKTHFENNDYMAIDVASNKQKLTTYAPSLVKDGQDQAREYTVRLAENQGTTGETIELYWKEEGVDYAWSIGHMNERWVNDGDVVKTGDQIGLSGGCPGELKLNEVSTGCHVHIELRIDGQAVEYPFDNNSKHTETGRLSFGTPQPWTEGLV